jgi:hypothetical protein
MAPRGRGAPRSMKMGNIASPWQCDAAVDQALQSANLRRPVILRDASWAAVFPDLLGRPVTLSTSSHAAFLSAFASNRSSQFHMYDLDRLTAETMREIASAYASKAMLSVEAFGINRCLDPY